MPQHRQRCGDKLWRKMNYYDSCVLLLGKLVLYPMHLYQCSGDEYVAFAERLVLMLRFTAFISIVLTAFEMIMLWCSSTMQLLRQFGGERSVTVLQLALLQAVDVLWDLRLPCSLPAADKAGEVNNTAAEEEYDEAAEGRPCFQD
jgi:hypothetical protein